ncbi:gustatory receptor for sugar taste 64f-like [Pararge aegeria]|uniref:gustatory receptor for sugar taste 64f-like n=1 Tax=Pararge aegeria TaxID=116150 RepID=UPI0019CF8711|nr:gustatory receptor for sugar taste 64f-like [Pararge aegeria]
MGNGIENNLCNNSYKEGMGVTPNGKIRAYAVYAVILIMLRSFAVALFSAKVNSESLVAAPTLYSVPSPTYCDEVQRFIEQIRGNTVALTGLNFFYVTKELILSVVGTIVTYELVLLQFGKV